MEFKSFLVYLLVCFLLSFLIGIERQYRRRIIGLRTTILVSIGAFLFVSMSFYGNYNDDVTRIASQVVSGIGFLGAGVIIKDGMKVRGLTTAATLWCDAAVGVLCASGAIYQAIAGTFIILFSNIVLRYVNRIVNQRSYNLHAIETYEIVINAKEELSLKVKGYINDFIKNNSRLGVEIVSVNIKDEDNNNVTLKIKLNIKKAYNRYFNKLIDDIYGKYSVLNISYKKLVENEIEEEEEL